MTTNGKIADNRRGDQSVARGISESSLGVVDIRDLWPPTPTDEAALTANAHVEESRARPS